MYIALSILPGFVWPSNCRCLIYFGHADLGYITPYRLLCERKSIKHTQIGSDFSVVYCCLCSSSRMSYSSSEEQELTIKLHRDVP